MGVAKEVACPPPCSFRVRSESEEELVALVEGHAKKQHGKGVSRAEVLKLAK